MSEHTALEELLTASPADRTVTAHRQRSARCPSLARLARRDWTGAERAHIVGCPHCARLLRRAKGSSERAAAGVAAGLAALVALAWFGLFAGAPERFDWPRAAEAPRARPAPAPLRSLGAPAPPEVRSIDVRPDPVWRYLPAAPGQTAKPLERYTPPPVPARRLLRSTLAAPDPPAIPWSPGPSADSIERLFDSDPPTVQSL